VRLLASVVDTLAEGPRPPRAELDRARRHLDRALLVVLMAPGTHRAPPAHRGGATQLPRGIMGERMQLILMLILCAISLVAIWLILGLAYILLQPRAYPMFCTLHPAPSAR